MYISLNYYRRGSVSHLIMKLIQFVAGSGPSGSSRSVSCGVFCSVYCSILCTGSELSCSLGYGSCTKYWTSPQKIDTIIASGTSCMAKLNLPPDYLLLILVSVEISLLLLLFFLLSWLLWSLAPDIYLP